MSSFIFFQIFIDLAQIEADEAEVWHVYVIFDAEQEYINEKSKFD